MNIFSRISVLLIFFSLSMFMANAQTSQPVKVYEYRGELGKRPLADVEVVVGNASSTTSDKDGNCTIEFRSLTPGDKILVRRITRPGYVIFNQDVLDHWRVLGEDRELVVVMCEQRYIKELRDKYRRAVNESFEKDFEGRKAEITQRFHEGKVTQSGYEAEMNDLYNDQAEKLEEFDVFIEKFVYLDIEEINETEKLALDMICKGDVVGAIKVYESADLMGDYNADLKTLAELADEAEALKQKKAETVAMRDKAYERVKRYVALLRFQGGKENIDRSFQMLHDVAYSDTTNYPVLLDYAAYCTKCDNYAEAEAALRYCQAAPDTIVMIEAYIVQSNINSRRLQYKKSVDILERSCSYLKEQSEKRNAPTLYLTLRVKATLGLVSTYNGLRNHVGASLHRQELLDLSRRLVEQKNDSVSKRLLVEALYYAHYGYYLTGEKYDLQEKGYKEAIAIQEELYKTDPSGQGAMLAFLHNALSLTYARIDHDYGRVVEEREKSIALYEEAYPKNPKAYAGYLGGGYRTLALVYINAKNSELDKALPLLKKAETYIQQELRMSPEVSRFRLANLTYAYAQYYMAKKDYANCEEYTLKAIDEYILLSKQNPNGYPSTLKTLYSYLFVCLDQDKEKNAERIQMYRQQCKDNGIRL